MESSSLGYHTTGRIAGRSPAKRPPSSCRTLLYDAQRQHQRPCKSCSARGGQRLRGGELARSVHCFDEARWAGKGGVPRPSCRSEERRPGALGDPPDIAASWVAAAHRSGQLRDRAEELSAGGHPSSPWEWDSRAQHRSGGNPGTHADAGGRNPGEAIAARCSGRVDWGRSSARPEPSAFNAPQPPARPRRTTGAVSAGGA